MGTETRQKVLKEGKHRDELRSFVLGFVRERLEVPA
jgi:hypothetical protein